MKKPIALLLFVFLTSITIKAQIRNQRLGVENNTNNIEQQMLDKAKQLNLGNVHSESAHLRPTAGSGGYFLRFDGGWVYYNPTAKNVFEIGGDIMKKWGELGYETGELGFPTSDEKNSDKSGWKRMNTFDKGAIYWNDGRIEVTKSSNNSLTLKQTSDNGAALANKTFKTSNYVLKTGRLNTKLLLDVTKTIVRKPLTNNGGNSFKNPVVRSKEKTDGDKICKTEYRKLDVTNLNQDVLNPDDIKYLRLGAIYNLDEFKKGNYNNLTENRTPISLNIPGIKSIKVDTPNEATLADAMTELLNTPFVKRPTGAGQYYESKIVNSKTELEIAAGVSYSGCAYSASATFDYNEASTKNKCLVTYHYPVFTAQISSGKNYFTDENLNKNQDLVVIDGISYGAKLLVFFESELNQEKLKVGFSGNGWGVSANFSAEEKKELSETTFKIFLYGSSQPVRVINSYDQVGPAIQSMINEICAQNKKYPIELGAPISYSLRFLNGDIAATNCSANELPSRICSTNPASVTKNLTVNLQTLTMKGGNNFGWIDFEIIDGTSEHGRRGNDIKTVWNVNRDQATYQQQGDELNPVTSVTFENINAADRANGFLRIWTRLQNRKIGGTDAFLVKQDNPNPNEGKNFQHGDYFGQFYDIKLSDILNQKPGQKYSNSLIRKSGNDKEMDILINAVFN
jgi:hypothetical protein